MIYIVIIILLIYYAIVHDVNGISKNARNHYRIAFWMFFLLAGLRHGMGGDTYQYRIFWETLPTFNNVTWEKLTCYRYDMGWVLLSFVMKSIFVSFVSLQILLSLILNLGIFRTVKKFSRYPFIVILVFFIVGEQYFNIEFVFMRQAYSVAIFLLWGIDCLYEHKYVKYMFVVLLCGLMHSSAYILIILPILFNMNYSMKSIKRLVLYSFNLFLLLWGLSNIYELSNLFFVLRFINSIDDQDHHFENGIVTEFLHLNYAYLIYYLIIFCGYLFYRIRPMFVWALAFGLLVLALAPYVGDFQRIMFCIVILIDISIAPIIYKLAKRNALLFISVTIGIFLSINILFYQRYSDKESTLFLYPYYSWFEDEPQSHRDYYIQRRNDGATLNRQIYNNY